MTCAATTTWLAVLSVLLLCVRDSASLFLPDSKELRRLLSRYEEEADQNGTSNVAGSRSRRAIRWSDREEILQLHNKLRGGVYPTASNMEHMVRHFPRDSHDPFSHAFPIKESCSVTSSCSALTRKHFNLVVSAAASSEMRPVIKGFEVFIPPREAALLQ